MSDASANLVRLQLLGGFKLTDGERVITRFRTQKTAALLAYMAYHQERPHPRDFLIGLFWPEAEPESGRHSLSLALSSLRNQLEPPGVPTGTVLVADRWSVELNPDHSVTDIREFEQSLREAMRSRDDDRRRECLETALGLYRGKLLPGMYEDWILPEQSRLGERYQQAVQNLVDLLERTGEVERALGIAGTAVRMDPLHEGANALQLRLLLADDQAVIAHRIYQEFERRLEEELGEAPSKSLRSLGEQARVAAEGCNTRPVTIRRTEPPIPTEPVVTLRPPSGTVTFLFTDIEGSTATWERERDGFTASLQIHNEILAREGKRHSGYLFKNTGDGLLFAFSGAGDALACAVAAQRALHHQAWPEGASGLKVRMALHSGDVSEQDGDYRGLTLHQASRILGAAHGGQILCSESTSGLLRRDLETEITLRDLGAYRLRDVKLPERLLQVDYAGMPVRDYPSPRAERAHSGNIPRQFTRFFGRDTELTDLAQRITRSGERLITLTGPGGTGKSRIAIELAGRLADHFSGAVWFVPLADIEDPALVPEVIASAMELDRDPSQAPLDQLISRLSRQPTLLVLDNLEQLVAKGDSASEVVNRLLSEVEHLVCLVTSRQVLGLTGEQEFAVPPLPTPDQVQDRVGLGVYDSVRLFVDRAQAVKPDFQVTNGNAPSVAELCNRLEGIPLAIELAAARAQVLSPAQMLQQLNRRFDFLVSRKRGVAERQRTLRTAVDWSFRLLDPDLQKFFAQLGVFRGGLTVEAAEQVTQDPLALDCLAQLREASLVQTLETSEGVRFRLMDSLREYAIEQLDANMLRTTQERHAQFFTSFAEQADEELRGPDQARWLHLVAADHDNLRAALEWADRNERPNSRLRLVGALWYFWSIRGHASEGRRAAEAAVAAAPGAHHPLAPRLLARAQLAAGVLAHDQSDLAASRGMLEASLANFRHHGTKADTGQALNCLANVLLDSGAPADALPLYEEALALYRDLEDHRGASIALSNLGVLHQDAGDLGRAAELLSESVRLKRKLGNPFGLANSLDSLGSLELQRGHRPRARQLYEEALQIRDQIGHLPGRGITLGNLGRVEILDEAWEAASRYLAESFNILHGLGDLRGCLEALVGVAQVALIQGDAQRAARILGAVRSQLCERGLALDPNIQAAWDQCEERVRVSLGSIEATSEIERGGLLDTSQLAELISAARETGELHVLA